jgi:hypothetical protein
MSILCCDRRLACCLWPIGYDLSSGGFCLNRGNPNLTESLIAFEWSLRWLKVEKALNRTGSRRETVPLVNVVRKVIGGQWAVATSVIYYHPTGTRIAAIAGTAHST